MLLVYVACLLVSVRGVEGVGLTAALVGWFVGLTHGQVSAVAVGLVGAATGANLINNVPATLVLLSGTSSRHLEAQLRLPFLMGEPRRCVEGARQGLETGRYCGLL